MRSYLDLTAIQAKVNHKQSRMTRLCIFLSVFLIMGLFGMADMEIKSQEIHAIQKDGSWHAIFRGLSEEQTALLRARPEIEASAGYAAHNYQLDEAWMIEGTRTVICGIEAEFLQMMPAAQIAEGRFPEASDEIVCTDSIRDRLGFSVGDPLTIQSPDGTAYSFTISGFSPATSMLTRADAFGVIVNLDTYRSWFQGEAGAEEVLYVQFTPYCRIQRVLSDIREQMELTEEQVGQNALLLGLRFQSNDTYLVRIYLVVLMIAVLVSLAGILMITGSLNSSVAQRTEFFGMMRCLGATPGQAARFVRREALLWCRTAIPAALLAGTGIIWILCAILRVLSPGYFQELPVFGISWIGIASGTVLGLLTVLIAARTPAKKASRVSPLTAVSGNAGTVHAIRRAADTRRIPVELALGIHHAKGSLKNFLLMSGSFAFGILLFLSFGTLHDFMNHALTPLRPDAPDLTITIEENMRSCEETLAGRLEAHPAVRKVYIRSGSDQESGSLSIDLQVRRGTTETEVEDLRALAGEGAVFSDHRKGNAEVMGAYYAFLLFLYGFLALILMISAFHIINSMSMSVSARMGTYRSLFAIGMSRTQLLFMIAAEAGTYLIFSFVTGIPAGLWFHRQIFGILITSRWGDPWRLPAAGLLTVLTVLAVSTAVSLIGPAARIRKMG